MKTLLLGINSKYIHPNMAIRLLKVNCDYDVDLKEFNIKDDPKQIINYVLELEKTTNLNLIPTKLSSWINAKSHKRFEQA